MDLGVANPVVIHVVRPYASEDEYIAAEAWSIDSKSMFLIDGPELSEETLVRFDIALGNGQKVIRAEGKVVAALPAIGDRPAGLKVRFKRFGAATKAFIDRAVSARTTSSSVAKAPSIRPPVRRADSGEVAVVEIPEPQPAELVALASPEPSSPVVSILVGSSATDTQAAEPAPPIELASINAIPVAPPQAESQQVAEIVAMPIASAPEAVPDSAGPSSDRASGVHRRTARSVTPPPNRDALLDRLRERGRVLLATGKMPAPRRDKVG